MRFPSNRRLFLGGALALGAGGLLPRLSTPASAEPWVSQACGAAATETMRGGSNNYVPNAPLVENLGKGFVVSGVVRKAGTCEPIANIRVQIWAATDRGGEREPSNRGSVMTDAEGRYRLETSPIVPQFGQPHIHIAYDDPGYETLFLRPVLKSRHDKAISVDFALAPKANGARQS